LTLHLTRIKRVRYNKRHMTNLTTLETLGLLLDLLLSIPPEGAEGGV
jgi:hypothetical protein